MKKIKYEGKDLICRMCKGRYYKTTDQFKPDRLISANMFEMNEPYKSQNWRQFPKDPEGINGYGNLVCPNCDSEYANMFGFAIIDGIPERKHSLTAEEFAVVDAERTAREKPLVVEGIKVIMVYVCEICGEFYFEKDAALNCLQACKDKQNGLTAGQ